MFCLFQTFRPDSRGTSNRASGTRSGVRRWYSRIFKQLSDINIIEGKKIYPVANNPIACKKNNQPEKYLLIYSRSGAGCVLEDTELVGGDIPAILGGGFEINLWNIFSAKPQLPGPGSWRYISTFQVASLWTETRLTSVLGGLQLYKHSNHNLVWSHHGTTSTLSQW